MAHPSRSASAAPSPPTPSETFAPDAAHLSKPLGGGAPAALGSSHSLARRRLARRTVPRLLMPSRIASRKISPCPPGRSCRPPSLPPLTHSCSQLRRGEGEEPAIGGRPPALFRPAAGEPVLARGQAAGIPAPRARAAAAPCPPAYGLLPRPARAAVPPRRFARLGPLARCAHPEAPRGDGQSRRHPRHHAAARARPYRHHLDLGQHRLSA